MSEQELIREFQYNGCDINKYQDNVEIVNTNESKFIDGGRVAIATTRTFSCTNILVFNKDFAYLAHIFPTKMVGMNNDFNKRLSELRELLLRFNPSEINILISLGESVPAEGKQDFHNLTYLYNKLNSFAKDCDKLNIAINLLPVVKSKYLLFDLEKHLLFIDNPSKEVIDIYQLYKKSVNLSENEKKN